MTNIFAQSSSKISANSEEAIQNDETSNIDSNVSANKFATEKDNQNEDLNLQETKLNRSAELIRPKSNLLSFKITKGSSPNTLSLYEDAGNGLTLIQDDIPTSSTIVYDTLFTRNPSTIDGTGIDGEINIRFNGSTNETPEGDHLIHGLDLINGAKVKFEFQNQVKIRESNNNDRDVVQIFDSSEITFFPFDESSRLTIWNFNSGANIVTKGSGGKITFNGGSYTMLERRNKDFRQPLISIGSIYTDSVIESGSIEINEGSNFKTDSTSAALFGSVTDAPNSDIIINSITSEGSSLVGIANGGKDKYSLRNVIIKNANVKTDSRLVTITEGNSHIENVRVLRGKFNYTNRNYSVDPGDFIGIFDSKRTPVTSKYTNASIGNIQISSGSIFGPNSKRLEDTGYIGISNEFKDAGATIGEIKISGGSVDLRPLNVQPINELNQNVYLNRLTMFETQANKQVTSVSFPWNLTDTWVAPYNIFSPWLPTETENKIVNATLEGNKRYQNYYTPNAAINEKILYPQIGISFAFSNIKDIALPAKQSVWLGDKVTDPNLTVAGEQVSWENNEIKNLYNFQYALHEDMINQKKATMELIGSIPNYELNYSGNGETSGTVPTGQPYTAQDVMTIADKGQLQKEGYDFSGWNTKADGSGQMFQPNEEFKGEENKGGNTLYAQWEKQRPAETTVTVEFVNEANEVLSEYTVQLSGLVGDTIDLTQTSQVTSQLTTIENAGYKIDARPENESSLQIVENLVIQYKVSGTLNFVSAPKLMNLNLTYKIMECCSFCFFRT
ncbi:hypothetical protein GCM10011573_37640 [Enterococcus wangshanyuanii]|uniref:Bacterial repeat domain-containing protein n=1 Tax=Enterococcus wangshanyuanii TaxID=2005703 RepID=A0ABQ1PUV9_9ENTE|nr:hypothetical protein GCM10011573_37640 [Enterococcus wangshanyuanii]